MFMFHVSCFMFHVYVHVHHAFIKCYFQTKITIFHQIPQMLELKIEGVTCITEKELAICY